MGITVKGDEALKLLELLGKMDEEYVPTEEEWAYLGQIETLDFCNERRDYSADECSKYDDTLFAFALNIDMWGDYYFITPQKVPESIGNLSNLQRLDLSGTQISTLPESIGNLSNLQELGLYNTEISTLPDFIGNLSNLQQLNLSDTQIGLLPDSIGRLSNLQSLDLSRTYISVLPDSIGNLFNLQELDLFGTQISTLPESIGNLFNLQSLNLFGTQISTLPESIGNLANLQELDLSVTRISTLSKSIGNLSNLKRLDLSHTQISTLPVSIGNLSNLQSLGLSWTQIGTLPDFIGNLFNLQELGLSWTQIGTLPDFIGNLSNLQELDLSRTYISVLPECIGNLSNLQTLNLSFTQISALPESIGNLTSLQSLNLFYTRISTLPESIDNLTSLKRLDLRGLYLQQLPRSLFNLGLDFSFDWDSTDGIDLIDTTLSTQPISLFHQPRELIQAYYDAPKDTINDAKVIFLGDGGVGKSRTIQRLLAGGEPGDYPTEMTPGIDISSYRTTYNGHPVDLRIWDFGGQEIMHAMHRCFLTGRTCYVVMVSNRAGNRTQRARYWLKTIESFAPNCPVILAVNLWDTDKGTDGINNELLAQEFPNVITQEPIVYSAKGSDKEHFNRLAEAIVEQASRLDSCGMEFPKSWANIRAALLEKQAKETPYISKADYLKLCEDSGETDPQICSWLLEWFNDLGVCFSYHTDKTSGQELENYQVLSPKWLFDAVYRLINQGGDFAQRGVLPRKGIESILKDYLTGHGESTSNTERKATPDYTYILEVMRKFRLSYPVDKESEFIPALCPEKWEKAPQTADWDSHVTYEMQYEYLPDTVLHRLMIFCKANHLLEQAWNGGMELSHDFDRLHAAIYLREESSTLEINAYAKDGRKPWALLEILRSELRTINTDLNLEAEDVIVMQKNQQTAHFPVAAVLKAVDRNIPTLYSVDGGELEEYQVNEILGAAFDMNKVEEEKKKAEEEKRPMSEQKITYHITNNFSGDFHGDQNYGSTVNHNTTEDAKELLRQVLDHQERVTEQFMDTLLEVLRESREQPVQKLVAEVDTAPKKRRWKTFCSWLNGGVGLAANLVTVAGAVAPHLGELQQVASAFLPGL